MNKKTLFGIGILAYALLITIIHVFRLGGDNYETLTKLITVATPLIAVIAGYYSSNFFSAKTLQGKSILVMTFALSLWLLADILWMMSGSEVLSVADIFYIGGYLLLMIATIIGIKSIKEDFFKDKNRLLFIGSIALAMTGIYLYYFFPGAWEADASVLQNVINSLYVINDLILLLLIVLLASLVVGGYVSKPWLVIGLGIVIYVIGDMHYAMNAETYVEGGLIDLTWYFGYLLFAYAFLLLRTKAEEIMKT